MKEQWIDQMRQKMADYQEPAPVVSWEEIEKAVAGHQQKGKAVPARQKTKAVPMWLRKMAAAILLFVIIGVGYIALEYDAPDTGRLTEIVESHQVLSSPHTEKPYQEALAENTLMAQTSRLIKRLSATDSLAVAVEEAEVTPRALEETESEPATLPSEPEEEAQDDRTEQRHTNIYHSQSLARPSNPYKSTALENRLTAKLYFSNTMGNSDALSMSSRNVINGSTSNPGSTYNPQDNPNSGGTWNTDLPYGDNPDQGNSDENGLSNGGNNDNNPEIQPADNNYTKTITTTHKIHHHQPIRYGLSLRYRLNERWGIETGLTYTLLTSDIMTTEEGRITESEQRLNYIGIPLKAEYTIWGNRHFNVYASAGAIVEKMVKGSLETTGKGTKESLSIRPLQFSISSGVGAEYKFSDVFSIYVEPGMGYYFDNGSSVPTFYQDKPLNFNLNVGLRFQLNSK